MGQERHHHLGQQLTRAQVRDGAFLRLMLSWPRAAAIEISLRIENTLGAGLGPSSGSQLVGFTGRDQPGFDFGSRERRASRASADRVWELRVATTPVRDGRATDAS